MGIMFNEVWTQARISRLTALWAAGLSASQIADDLGCFKDCRDNGRSAVIGKIHRLKLPHPAGKMVPKRGTERKSKQGPLGVAPAEPSRPFLAPPPAPRLRNGHDPSQRRNPSQNILAAIALAETEPGLPENLKGDAPNGTGVKFIDLAPGACKWPKGDPLAEDFEFCGGHALVDSPYCSHHSRIAFVPAADRRRQQARI